jgi:hypothetical protein
LLAAEALEFLSRLAAAVAEDWGRTDSLRRSPLWSNLMKQGACGRKVVVAADMARIVNELEQISRSLKLSASSAPRPQPGAAEPSLVIRGK